MANFPFTLDQLKILQTITVEGNFKKAAERLYVSQPAISLQIQNLEKQLNIPIFYRDKRQARLTETGELLVKYADRILNLCKQHIGRPERADEHYRACSRALVANAFELRKFLEKINSANLQLRKMQTQENSVTGMSDKFAAFLEMNADDLDTSAWANLWMTVMKELRDGVTLRNCEKRHSPIPKQYS